MIDSHSHIPTRFLIMIIAAAAFFGTQQWPYPYCNSGLQVAGKAHGGGDNGLHT
jgi:hypothetical protein